MRKWLKTPLYILFLVVVGFLLFKFSVPVRESIFYLKYRIDNGIQADINTIDEVNAIYNKFEHLTFDELPKSFKEQAKYKGKYSSLGKDKTFLKVKGNEVFKTVASNLQLRDLIAKESYYDANIRNLPEGSPVYIALDKKLLQKVIEFEKALKKQGYNSKAYSVSSCYRTPNHNEAIKGASMSRHMAGEAIDITVGDINKNGISNKEDKDIVLEILDKSVIANKGGIGRYPGSMSVHFDVRGSRARWDSY